MSINENCRGRRGYVSVGQVWGSVRTVTVAALLIGVFLPALLGPAAASGWGAAGFIETDNAGGASFPQVASDGRGNAVAVWAQSDGTRTNMWANRYVPGTGWGTAGLIETDNAGAALSQQVAVDPQGNAVAVWAQGDGTRDNIWSNRYVAGTGWGNARLIETDNAGFAIQPDVAMQANGDAVVVWRQSDGVRFNIWANRYVVGTGWGVAGLIETDNVGGGFDPHVAVDGSGNAVAVWRQFDGTRDNVWANRYVAGTGWAMAALIETDNAGYAFAPDVAVDGSGNAVAVWPQNDGTRENIWANRYVAGTGWGMAGLLETDNAGGANSPQAAADGNGNVIVVWQQNDGTRNNIWASRYVLGSGWGAPVLLEANNAGSATAPQVAVDARGAAVAVWYQSDGVRQNIWGIGYDPGITWGAPELIEADNMGSALDPQVAVDPSGNAVVVWRHSDGTRDNIAANQLVEDFPPPIVLYAPADGSSTNMSAVWVWGATEPGATAAVNGLPVYVAPDGSFGLPLGLSPGRNWIIAGAWDRAGNEAFTSTNITFNDPLPALEQELAGAQADLAAVRANLTTTQSALAATQSDLTAAMADLSAAQASVSALEANATAAQAELAAGLGNLTAALATVAALEAQANATEAQLTAAQADVTAAQSKVASLEAGAAATQASLAAARADLTLAQNRIGALESTQNSTQSDLVNTRAESASASSQVGLAMVLAAAAIALALLSTVLALRRRRDPKP